MGNALPFSAKSGFSEFHFFSQNKENQFNEHVWRNVILSPDLNLQIFFEVKNKNLCQDLKPGLQKSYN